MVHSVVVGGGIAGVCCVEELAKHCPNDAITLVSASDVLKGVRNVFRLTKNIEELEVDTRPLASFPYPNVRTIVGVAAALDTQTRTLTLASGDSVPYDKICVCTGATPRVVSDHPHVVTLRDTESVEELQRRLVGARRVAVVGNGGIALELVTLLRTVKVIWAAKHGHVGDAFFDRDAAAFLLEELEAQRAAGAGPHSHESCSGHEGPHERSPHAGHVHPHDGGASSELSARAASGATASASGATAGPVSHSDAARRSGVRTVVGHAVGPRWAEGLRSLMGAVPGGGGLVVERDVEVAGVVEGQGGYPVRLELSNGHAYDVDFIVSAIGVEPATDWLPPEIQRAEDGGVLVNNMMQSSVPGVYAAGDACTFAPASQSPQWFQMRLWTQARLTGSFAAHCIAGLADELALGFNFELFSHVTRFCGKKIILLGLYNGQKLASEPASDIVMYSRVAEAEPGHRRGCCRPGPVGRMPSDDVSGRTFVRVLLLRGRMQGAVLIGETDLEEAFENLILNGLDISQYGPEILNPEFEVEHVFD